MNFFKYQGAGNDFIMCNGFSNTISLNENLIKYICDRRFGIGADGFILIKPHANYDFEMNYYNADGKPGSMCGNGGRCAVRFAQKELGIENTAHFIASDGEHTASIFPNSIQLLMKNVSSIEVRSDSFVLNTGSPHYVSFLDDITDFDVYEKGKAIRNSDEFKEEGINVNFVQLIDDNTIFIRTFERGVEDETLSCGTGATASALALMQMQKLQDGTISVTTLGGTLHVSAQQLINSQDSIFNNIWLEGPAQEVFSGTIEI